MGDMSNGGPGYGGYGQQPWNPYGRGPQQPRWGSPMQMGSYAPMMGPDGRMHDTTPGSMAGSWMPQPFGGGQTSGAPSQRMPTAPAPGSFSAGVAALNRGDPNARNMLGAAAGLPPQTGTYSSQGPQPGPFTQAGQILQQQFTPNQMLMMQSGRGQRGFWQGPTSPFGMQGPGSVQGPGYNPPGYGNYRQRVADYGGMQNGAPK